MPKVTALDFPAVNNIAGNLETAIAEFATALAEMKRVAAELDGCWSDDEAGKAFAASYLANAEKTLANGDLTVESVTLLATNLRKVAEMFSELDADSGGVLILKDS
jgi:hypothetical protein